jgi:hypothetical protein
MKILQALDVFGVAYNFNLNNSQSYKSSFGGVMSIICLFMLTVFMYFFGIDFYYKKNPKVIGSTVYNKDYYTIPLNSSQGIIAWKIEDHYTNMPNFTGILFPRIVYKKFLENPETKFLDFIGSDILPQKRCDEVEDIDLVLKTNYDLKAWWCLDFTGANFTFGGYWGGKVVNMIYLLIDACNEDKSHCSSLKEVQSLAPGAENSLFFSMLYPQAYFSPNDLNSPLNYAYYYFTETIDLHVIKKNVFFFTKYILEDDLGWIAQDVRTSSIFVYQSFFKDYFYKDASKWSNVTKDQNTVVYMNGLYFDKNPFLYTRSFMKIQDLAAVVGGALKSTILIFALFSRYVNTVGITTHFGNIFFTRRKFDKPMETNPRSRSRNFQNSEGKKFILQKMKSNFTNSNGSKEKKFASPELIDSNEDFKTYCKTKDAQENIDFEKNQFYKDLQKEKFKSAKLNENIQKADTIEELNCLETLKLQKTNGFDLSSSRSAKFLSKQLINKNKESRLFSMGKSICRCNSSKQRKELKLVDNFLLNKVSLESYLYNELLFQNLLNLLLEKNQKTLFTSVQQINLNNPLKMKEITRDGPTDEGLLQEILDNYYSKLQNGKLTLNDMKIISMIQTD